MTNPYRLHRLTKWDKDANYRLATALIIEARVRGYSAFTECPECLPIGTSFNDFMNRIIDWLAENYPDEFKVE